MHYISITYTLKWQFKNYRNYKVSKCKRIFNTKTNREVMFRINGGIVGVWIGKKFIPKSKINSYIELIPKEETPF